MVTKGIAAGSFYYARIRANYPGYFFSDWTYLGSKAAPLAVCVGTGTVDAKFGAPANLKTSNIAETGFKDSWDPVPFATGYVFEYKAASSGEWQVVGDLTATSYDVEGLVGLTTYDTSASRQSRTRKPPSILPEASPLLSPASSNPT